MTTTALSEKKLLAHLIIDDIELEEGELQKLQDGDSFSQSKMGDIYYKKEDYVKAVNWYNLGATNNNVHAQYHLGCIYQEGKGVPKDYRLAMGWLWKAYNNGNLGAANMIGVMYHNGEQVVKSYQVALKWYHKAANKGHSCAMNNIGLAYEHGRGVDKEVQTALEWYEKSAEKGFEGAKENIKRLNKEGLYFDEKLRRYRQIIKELGEQKSKVEGLEDQLKVSEKKQLESDNEIKLLKKQFEEFKMLLNPDAKDKVNTKQKDIDEMSDTDSSTTGDWVKTDTIKDEEADQEKS